MKIIIVDLETTGLDTHRCAVTEVAAIEYHDDTGLCFIPHLDHIDPETDGPALSVNRYFERKVFKSMLSMRETQQAYRELHEKLQGNVVAGFNPRFDTNILSRVFAEIGLAPEPWHHRLMDISAYAAGVLALGFSDMETLPGAHEVCDMLGVVNETPHEAIFDVMAARECLKRLQKRALG